MSICATCGLPVDEHGTWTWERLVESELRQKRIRRNIEQQEKL